MDLTKIFSGMDKGPEAIQANFEKLKDFANATTVSIDHTNSIVPAIGKLKDGYSQADIIRVGTTLSIFMIDFTLIEVPTYNEWQNMKIGSVPKSFLGGATHAIKLHYGLAVGEGNQNNGFNTMDFDLDTNTGNINMYFRNRYPHDSGSQPVINVSGVWLLY